MRYWVFAGFVAMTLLAAAAACSGSLWGLTGFLGFITGLGYYHVKLEDLNA